MRKKQKIIKEINEKDENWYRSFSKQYLSKYSTLNEFEISIFSEVIYEMIANHRELEDCFEKVSNEYNVNCKRIAFFAIMPIKLKIKIYYLLNVETVIYYFFHFARAYVIKQTFSGNSAI